MMGGVHCNSRKIHALTLRRGEGAEDVPLKSLRDKQLKSDITNFNLLSKQTHVLLRGQRWEQHNSLDRNVWISCFTQTGDYY